MRNRGLARAVGEELFRRPMLRNFARDPKDDTKPRIKGSKSFDGFYLWCGIDRKDPTFKDAEETYGMELRVAGRTLWMKYFWNEKYLEVIERLPDFLECFGQEVSRILEPVVSRYRVYSRRGEHPERRQNAHYDAVRIHFTDSVTVDNIITAIGIIERRHTMEVHQQRLADWANPLQYRKTFYR